MPFNIGSAIGVVSGVAGLLGGKKSTATPTSKAISGLLESTAKRLKGVDPYADIDAALKLSEGNVQRIAEQALRNVFAKYAVEGSRSDLPDSARSGVQRGVLADILNQRLQIEADARLNALPRWTNMISQIVGTASAGRGENQSVSQGINAPAFAKDVGSLLESLRRPSGKIF